MLKFLCDGQRPIRLKLLCYPRAGGGVSGGVRKMFKIYVKVFMWLGKVFCMQTGIVQ